MVARATSFIEIGKNRLLSARSGSVYGQRILPRAVRRVNALRNAFISGHARLAHYGRRASRAFTLWFRADLRGLS